MGSDHQLTGDDTGPKRREDDDVTAETVRRSPPSPSRADGPPEDPYAGSPGASIDTDDPVEPNEPA